MNHMKKLLSLVLALVMCLSLAVPAFAAKPEFEINGTTLNKYNGSGGDVRVPDGVTTISGNAFYYNKDVTSVTLPDSVTSINRNGINSAFAYASSLKNVYLSNNLTSIAASAFRGCTSLASVTLPNSVTSIGDSAFSGCSSMKTLTLSNNLVSMGDSAFRGCTSLLSIDVPGSIAIIPADAFNGCSSVKSITIREGVKTIDKDAFQGCSSTTRLTLPASVTKINMLAFYGLDGLRDVYYGGSEEQWNAIDINSAGNGPLKEATIHYNSPMPEPAPSFRDVSVSQYYATPVAWAAGSGIAQGTSTWGFSPNNTCTQAQILTFLFRAMRGANSATIAAPTAADMDEAVQWARETGMIDSSFVATTPCTRATAVYYIWMAFGSNPASGSNFTDVPAGANYATSVSWAVQNSVTTGTSATTFNPTKTCTRAEIVTFLYRAYVK